MTNPIDVRISARAYVTLPDQKKLVFVYKSHKGTGHSFDYDMPGGGLEPFESPEQCALRELREETNLIGYSNGLVCEYDKVLTYFDRFENVEKTVRRVGWVFDVDVRDITTFKLEQDDNLLGLVYVTSDVAKRLLRTNYPEV